MGPPDSEKKPSGCWKRIAWTVGVIVAIYLFAIVGSYCVEYNGPAVKDGPRYQDGEFDDDYVEYDPPARDVDINEQRGPEPTSPDAGAYNYDE